ncbi:MAG: DUF2905 domain-containing protein [Fibrobacterota bacterium]
MTFEDVGRFLLIAGGIIFFLGVLFLFFRDMPNIRLWGDIFLRKGDFQLYIPVTTSIIVSLVITLIVNIFIR